MAQIHAIEAEGLTRVFGSYTAVDHLSIAIERGEIFGLLGPNGAGKTTTIRMLTTLLAPSSGTARVCGFDVMRQPSEIRRRIGYVMQQLPSRYPLTGREAVEIEAGLHHIPRREAHARAAEVLELVELTEAADRQVAQYSGGMQKRLDLACGLLARPEVLVLDEPTLGLDVQSRHHMWEHVRALQTQGVTILLATNYLDEADRLCNRLTIIDHGREIVTDTPVELKRQVGGDALLAGTPRADALRDAVAGQPWVKNVAITEARDVHVYVEEAPAALPLLMALAAERAIPIERLTYNQPTLDDVFLLHTGRELREQGGGS